MKREYRIMVNDYLKQFKIQVETLKYVTTYNWYECGYSTGIEYEAIWENVEGADDFESLEYANEYIKLLIIKDENEELIHEWREV